MEREEEDTQVRQVLRLLEPLLGGAYAAETKVRVIHSLLRLAAPQVSERLLTGNPPCWAQWLSQLSLSSLVPEQWTVDECWSLLALPSLAPELMYAQMTWLVCFSTVRHFQSTEQWELVFQLVAFIVRRQDLSAVRFFLRQAQRRDPQERGLLIFTTLCESFLTMAMGSALPSTVLMLDEWAAAMRDTEDATMLASMVSDAFPSLLQPGSEFVHLVRVRGQKPREFVLEWRDFLLFLHDAGTPFTLAQPLEFTTQADRQQLLTEVSRDIVLACYGDAVAQEAEVVDVGGVSESYLVVMLLVRLGRFNGVPLRLYSPNLIAFSSSVTPPP